MNKLLRSNPISDGFFMPGEFSEHLGTIMIYPTRPGSWGKDRSDTLWSFGQVFLEILKRENLYLLVDEANKEEARSFMEDLIRSANEEERYDDTLFRRLYLWTIDSDDSWARDVGPTFVIDKDGNRRGINWSFNAWGGEVDGLYASWDKDDKVAASFCDKLSSDYYDASPFVLEGGSIHSDGEGTVMVTESCLLSPGRNPELSKEQIEDKLKTYLGAKKVLWLPKGIYNDETNEHVDNVCAFIRPGEVVLAWTDDESDPQYAMSAADLEYLESVTDAKGRQIIVHKLPIPEYPVLVTEEDLSNYEFEEGEDNREAGERLAASYVNFYFVNGAALVPQFGGVNAVSDKRALGILKELCPEREVIGIDARPILLGGGNIHCITQQIPKAQNDSINLE
ncbi:agmatine deiminase [Butyrivibrio sp. CB08]|uniref:agmatine deiminase n=1 Tax=Butyrivibrio sp. CB08 TaxID=2364879 RepID=UPI000EA84ADF|nr:agmatine deiminase [Butyrivibrio sp. CB08]RKM56000.1 agmatine deiminase [Butyrivibrio sp. CB08]